MISLEHAKRSDRLMRATTSLTVREFDELAGRFGVAWAATRAAKTAAGTTRQRRPGGGRKGCLVSAEQKLFFILLYFKAYPTQDVMGLLFGITQGQVSEWVRQLTAVVGQLIPLHRPARQARDLNQLLRAEPELEELIIDGTERRLPRPQHRGKQKRFYSGRKKRHAVKNVLMVASAGGCGVRPPCRASVMIRRWLSERDCVCPSRSTFWVTVASKAWRLEPPVW